MSTKCPNGRESTCVQRHAPARNRVGQQVALRLFDLLDARAHHASRLWRTSSFARALRGTPGFRAMVAPVVLRNSQN